MTKPKQPKAVPPKGWRLLRNGEEVRAGDMFCFWPGDYWKPCAIGGGAWNMKQYYPMARRINENTV